MSQPQQIDAAIQQYAAIVQQRPCPWCGQHDWDSGGATLTPIATQGQPFDTDAPYKHNPLFVTIVFTCRQCGYVLTFSPGGLQALKPGPGGYVAPPTP